MVHLDWIKQGFSYWKVNWVECVERIGCWLEANLRYELLQLSIHPFQRAYREHLCVKYGHIMEVFEGVWQSCTRCGFSPQVAEHTRIVQELWHDTLIRTIEEGIILIPSISGGASAAGGAPSIPKTT